MKKILLIPILASMIIACSGQDVCTYSQKYVDSLNSIIKTQEVEINQQLLLLNVQGDYIGRLQTQIDSLLNTAIPDCDSLVFSDDLSITITNDGYELNITKSGANCSAYIKKDNDLLTIKKE